MRKRYTQEEIEFIKQQALLGVNCSVIGGAIGVSATAIQHILSRNAITFCRNPYTSFIGEIWVNCLNIPDIKISNYGRFARISSNSLIQGYLTTGGYVTVDFSGIGSYSAHRLVAQVFIENPENKPEVNHKDGCKTNNCIDNLEWATPSENIQHSIRTGLSKFKSGQEHHRTALHPLEIISCAQMADDGATYRLIADIKGVDRHTVSKHVNQYRRSTERSETIP